MGRVVIYFRSVPCGHGITVTSTGFHINTAKYRRMVVPIHISTDILIKNETLTIYNSFHNSFLHVHNAIWSIYYSSMITMTPCRTSYHSNMKIIQEYNMYQVSKNPKILMMNKKVNGILMIRQWGMVLGHDE